MHADQQTSRRSQRRRPDLVVNTSRTKPQTTASHRPLSSPFRERPVPGARGSSRNYRTATMTTRSTNAAAAAGPAASLGIRGGQAPKTAVSSHAAAPTEVETFLEMYTPVESSANKENSQPMAELPPMPGQRDSHDLSLPSRHVRDSLVSNMLLSLDQFSMGQMGPDDAFAPPSSSLTASHTAPSFDDPRLYSLSTTTATDDIARLAGAHASSSRGGGSTSSTVRHGYSYSSDYDGADDASRVSGGAASRGRRSNSSSGFQPGLGRINSMRESGSQPATPRMVHSRGAKGSKSSSTNSIDTAGYAQVLGSQRWVHGIGARSSSFDMGQRPMGGPMATSGASAPLTSAALSSMAMPSGGVLAASSANMGPHPSTTAPGTSSGLPPPSTANGGGQPWRLELSNSFFSDAGYDDSAPTPTIPAGPRKLTSVPSMPSIPSFKAAPILEPVHNTRPSSRSPERRSIRSSRSATVGRQAQAKYNNTPPPPLPSAPVLPAFDLDSAPAPHIGYEKSKEAVPAPGPQQHAQHPKERPGFFRRMFGSLRDTVSGNEPGSAAAAAAAPTLSSSSPYVSGNPPDTAKSHSTPPSRDNTHNAVQKKPSGFFRRRKKSVSEMESYPPLPSAVLPQITQPPVPQQLSQPTAPQAAPLPPVPPIRVPGARDFMDRPIDSPVTSLRKAMNPYLKGSPAFPNGPSSLNPDSLAHHHGGTTIVAADDYEDDDPTTAVPHTINRKERERLDDTAGRSGRGFSPDYEPSPNATIRSVTVKGKEQDMDQSLEHEYEAELEADHETPLNRIETPARQPPKLPHPARSGSFLSDTSDSEESPKRTRDQNKTARTTLSTSAAAAVGSMLLSPNTDSSSANKKPGHAHESSQDETGSNQLTLPIEGAITVSPKNDSLSPRSALTSSATMPNIKIGGGDRNHVVKRASSSKSSISAYHSIDEPEFVVGDPTEDDRKKALNIFQGNEDFIQKDRAAAYMGEEGPVRQRTLRAYMDLYDFRNMSILSALREICSRLVLRAETQQVDRILVSFSKRWCQCNPRNGFKSLDIVHTICYSIMLLNTDLHLADIETKMTRGQFIKNTMTSIRQTLAESAPAAHSRPTILPNKTESGGRSSMDRIQPSSSETQLRSESSLGHHEDCGPLVRAPFDGPVRQWEARMETVLKDIYASIRDDRLPLFGGGDGALHNQNLSVMGMLKRTPSVLSKAPSESQASTRGRINDGNPRNGSSRWTSKSRSRARLPMGGIVSNGFSSSRTSFEDNNSIWSPAGSSATWSKQSLGRTQTSMSMESFGSSWARGDFQQSIGFANALSQAIIREDAIVSGAASVISDDQSHNADGALLEDDSLELAGPPWVKEGIVTHKHHLDGMDKKAKDRNWTEVFAVVQKGYLSLFSFTPNKSLRVKGRGRNNAALPKGAVVGGGNWQENATNLGSFGLKQTLASALPPPGYSSRRPHVWALSLPTGAVHLFQVGTPEICKEFVTTANYWSARLSTHPLIGGISNVEYGWSDNIVNNALVSAINETSSVNTAAVAASRPASAAAGRNSIQSRHSIRSGSFDFGHARTGSSSSGLAASATAALHSSGGGGRHGGKLPGDRIHIAEWSPPAQSLRGSTATESQQLQTLLAYVKGIEEDLQAHNALRSPMLLAFTPRGANATKAMSNWERKSSYLLREIVKYRTYVDCLTEAERRRSEVYHERDIARRAALGEDAPATDSEDNATAGHDVEDDSANNNGDNTDVTLRA